MTNEPPPDLTSKLENNFEYFTKFFIKNAYEYDLE